MVANVVQLRKKHQLLPGEIEELALLDELYAMIESGECVGFAFAAKGKCGDVITARSGDYRNNRELIGELMDCKCHEKTMGSAVFFAS